MRMGYISASWINGVLTLWVTTELAEKLTNPRVFFQPNNEILIKNDAPAARRWSSGGKTLREGQANIQFQSSKIRGQFPAKDFGKTDALECKTTVPGHYVLKLPTAKAAYRPRGSWKTKKTQILEKAVPPRIPVEEAVKKAYEETGTSFRAQSPKKIVDQSRSDIAPDAQIVPSPDWSQMTVTQRFREALAIVNETKASFGDQLEIKFSESGELKATMLIEF